MSSLLFQWTELGLTAANTGSPFTPGGLEALCASHMSDKGRAQEQKFISANQAVELIASIRTRRIQAYQGVPRDIVEQARSEVETGRDYSNRLLLELMQNADDAAAERPIGYKGLGFKAVLDICESPRIYSEHLRVRFDREESRQTLAMAGFSALDEVPVLRLPFENECADETVRRLIEGGEYATVIFLPWRQSSVIAPFSSEWDAVSSDATVLLLLHALEEVKWLRPGEEPLIWRCNRPEGRCEISIEPARTESPPRKWRIFRKTTGTAKCAAAVPVTEEGMLGAYRHDKLRVFFPTEEQSPLPMILHGDFELEQNRKHVRPGGNRKQVGDGIAACVISVLSGVSRDGSFLDLLRPRVLPVENMAGVEWEVWQAIVAAARGVVLPEARVEIGVVRLCPAHVPHGLPCWKAFKGLLKEHRPGGLMGLGWLPAEVDNEAREQTVLAINSGARLGREELRKIPLFPVEGREEPVAVADCWLFMPPAELPSRQAPSGVQVGFLRRKFAEGCQAAKGCSGFLMNLGIYDFEAGRVAEALDAQDLGRVPVEELWEYLLAAVAPLLKPVDAWMNWKHPHRASLARRVKVPCRDGMWRAAFEVYAGSEWTGDDCLDRTFGARKGTAMLCEPPKGELQRQAFERLARWLGVGWSPKVIPIVNAEGAAERLPRWKGGRFPIAQPPVRWSAHCRELDDGENEARRARLRRDWTLDGGEDVLIQDGVYQCVLREWSTYENFLKAEISRSSNIQKDLDNSSLLDKPSYLAHLFREVQWIPVTECDEQKAACDVFIADSAVLRELRGWVFSPRGEPPSERIARDIGIRGSWMSVGKADWNRWFERSAKLVPQENLEHQVLITALYRQALRHFGEGNSEANLRLWTRPLWCVEKRKDNTTGWQSGSGGAAIYYVDSPNLAVMRIHGIWLFPVELGWIGNKEKARKLFGVLPLSEHLQGRAGFTGGEDPASLQIISSRLRERENCLAAYLRVMGKEAGTVEERWRALSFRVGQGLTVSFFLHGQELSKAELTSHFEEGANGVCCHWLDQGRNFFPAKPREVLWEEVSFALCFAGKLPLEMRGNLELLLGCDDQSLERKLLNLGVTTADIQSALGSVTQTVERGAPTPAIDGGRAEVDERRLNETGVVAQINVDEARGRTLDDVAPTPSKLLERLREANERMANESPERVEAIVTRTIRSDSDMIKALKEYYEFRCQICQHRIPKKDGGYYIEVHHIKPVARQGPSVLGNLLVLCPNHHKEFEQGELRIVEQTQTLLHCWLNGEEYKITFPGI